MNAIEEGKSKIEALRKQLRTEAEKGYCIVNWMAKDATRILEQTANARALEVLKGLVVRIKKDAEYTNPKDDLEKIGELARSTGALKAVHRLQDLMSELLDKGETR